MVKRNKNSMLIKGKSCKISLKLRKANDKNNENIINNSNSNLADYILSENTFSSMINDLNEKELKKSNTSLEKSENGIITYTKIDIYENGKKIIKKVSMKDNKIIKNSTEIIEDNNNSEENSDNIEEMEKKIDENKNRINMFENKINNFEGRLNMYRERTINSINFIKRNYVRNRRDFDRERNRPLERNRLNERYRGRFREQNRRNFFRWNRERERSRSFSISSNSSHSSDSHSNELGNNFNSDNIPDTTLEDVDELDEEHKICSICLEEYKNNDVIKKLSCNHFFHSECLKIWLSNRAICPICRKDLRQNN